MGINLLVPKTPAQLPGIAVGTTGFAISFVLIAIVWWIHHRLFKSLFVLNTVMVMLNFAMLGSLVLMVYFQQISLHFIADGDRAEPAVQLWLVTYSVVYALLAAMMWIGVRIRWDTLAVADLRWGLSRAILASVGTLIFVAYGFYFQFRGTTRSLLIVPFVVIVTIRLLVPRLIDRLVVRRA